MSDLPGRPDLTDLRAQLMGDRAVLIDCSGSPHLVAASLRHAVSTGVLAGVTEVVPAARTVLVCCADWPAVLGVLAWAAGAEDADAADTAAWSDAVSGAVPTSVTLDVVYDGADLALAAELMGLSPEALGAAHTRAAWRADFGGFAPGFMYLSAPGWPFRLPRLDVPRQRVPAGAVAVAGEYSAVYPAASPGGWQLIGRTDAPMWDLDRAEPALVRPGDGVQFRAVRELVALQPEIVAPVAGASEVSAPAAHSAAHPAALTVARPGLQTLIQDLGRSGVRAVGVTESGAMDRAALARANTAVGNLPGLAALETVGGGLELRAEEAVTVAIAGTAASLEIEDRAGSRVVPAETPAEVLPGQRITLSHTGPGMRDYLAVGGGIGGRDWLGSRATDTLSGIGPGPLATGDELVLGAVSSVTFSATAVSSAADRAEVALEANPGTPVLRVIAGPREDWFAPGELRALTDATWTVGAQSDRVGARLSGPTLHRAAAGGAGRRAEAELPSEGMVRGALQVPPGGEPVLFLADHPVTGGYPVIAVVVDADLDRAGQLAPGDPVRFALVDSAAATAEGEWPAAEPFVPRPAWVSCTLEVDGRRHAIRIPGALAAVLDRAFDQAPDQGQEAPLVEAAHELIGELVRAIRNS